MKNIIFRVDVDQGNKVGTGHLIRILKLYKELKNRQKLKFYALSKSNNLSKKIIPIFFKKNILPFNKNFEKKLFFLKKNDLLINDTPKGLEKKLYLFCKKNKIKIISLDDSKRYSKQYDLLINSIIFLKNKLPKSKNIFQSFKYLIFDKKFEDIKKNKFVSKKLNIVISSGGTDKKNFLYKVCHLLKDFKNLRLNILIGMGVKKNNKIFSIKNKNINLIRNNLNIKKYFDNAHGAIVSGGLTMFESVLTKTPTAVIKTYDHQKYAIKELEKFETINYLGYINRISKNKLFNFIQLLKSKKNKKKYIKKKIKNNLIDSFGLKRVTELILKKINEK